MKIYGFDTETTLFDYNYTPKLKFWCITSSDFKKHGFTANSFMNFIQLLYDDMEEDIVIVALNLLYDYYFTMFYEKIKLFKNGKTIIRVLDSPNFASFTKPIITYEKRKKHKKTYTLTFIDLSNYFSGRPSLESIANMLELPTKHTKRGKYLMNKKFLSLPELQEFIDYCYRDAEICELALISLNPIINNKFKRTIASLSYADLKLRTGWKKFDRPKWIREAERLAYFGGRSGNNIMYRCKKLKAWKYDVHSMYPAMMQDYKVPITLEGYVSFGDIIQKNVFDQLLQILNSNTRTALINVDIVLNDDCIPHKSSIKLKCVSNKNKENQLCFQALDVDGNRKKLTNTWLSIYELIPAVQDHEIVLLQVNKIIIYKTKIGIFNPFVDHHYTIKSNSKGAKRNNSKLKLNSCTGKFGERKRIEINYSDIQRENIQRLIDIQEIKFGSIKIYQSKNDKNIFSIDKSMQNMDEISILVEGEDFHTTKLIQDDSFGACCIVVTEITARARRKLWVEGMRDYEWLQVDTDGVVLLEQMNESIIDNKNKTLGMWGSETCKSENYDKDYCNYIGYAKKDYRCQHKRYLKGVTKNAIETVEKGVTKWKYTVLAKPKIAKIRKIAVFSKIDIKKERK